jgi:hypothetical protein
MDRAITRRKLIGVGMAASLGGLAGCARAPRTGSAGVGRRRFGVVVHLERFPGERLNDLLDRLKPLGAGSVRGVVFPWSHIESPRGVWKWDAVDPQMDAVERASLEPIGCLGPSAAWASSLDPHQQRSPWAWSNYPPDDMDAWAGYVRRIMERYAGRIRIWSPYNEPDNLDLFCAPRTPVEARSEEFLVRRRDAFLRMQEITYTEAKRADPQCTVLSGAFSMGGRVDPDFLPWLLDRAYASLCDAFDVHAYDTLGAIRDAVLRARRLLADRGLKRPIWMSEIGAPVRRSGRGGRPFTPDDAAAFVTKAMATALSLGVERMFWYQGFHDGVTGITLAEPAHSLITAEGPTPAAQAYASVVNLLAEARYAGPMTAMALSGTATGHVFESPGKRTLIAWAEAPDGLPNTPARAEAVVWWHGRPRHLRLNEGPTILADSGHGA